MALLNHDENLHAPVLRGVEHLHAIILPAHFHILKYRVESLFEEWQGVGCQIRRQAKHGAAPSYATSPEAAELIPHLAAASVQLIF